MYDFSFFPNFQNLVSDNILFYESGKKNPTVYKYVRDTYPGYNYTLM